MEYKRPQFNLIKSRIEEPRRFIQVIAGPRQVGKTTLVNQVLSTCSIPYTSVNADAVADTDWISRTWETCRRTMRLNNESERLLVIDEIQKLDNWSEVVKKEWDSDTSTNTNLKVLLLGSSRLLIRKGLTESLAGRFEIIRMPHWSFGEMEEAFGFTMEQYVFFGGYPGAASMIGEERRWRKYVKDALVAPAIEKDALQTSNIYKPAVLRQLFSLGCGYSGELLSLTKMLGQLQDAGNVTTLASYLDLLDQCNLLGGLQQYYREPFRSRGSIPKYQVYNNALLSMSNKFNFRKVQEDPRLWGRWVESAVGAHLLSEAEELGYRVGYWRERDDEVDFVLYDNDITIGIEVKSGRRGMNGGLPKFRKLFDPCNTLVIGTDGMPLNDFLRCDMASFVGMYE